MRTFVHDQGSPRRTTSAFSHQHAGVQRATSATSDVHGARPPSPARQRLQAADTSGPLPASQMVASVLSTGGTDLDAAVRSRMERSFRTDFSRVRIHADPFAAASARALQASAFTVGRHVVFGAGRYDPGTPTGEKMLAHELTHVLQQGAAEPPAWGRPLPQATSGEREAHGAAARVALGARVGPVRGGHAPALSRFSDTGHHVIEAAGLAGAGFSDEQIEVIERGNVQRDYSQVGVLGNLFLLCKPQKFGGYEAVEHFDDFIWDAVTGGWRARGGSALGEKRVSVERTPIDFILTELDAVARGKNDSDLIHLGNAFHTVEDFFAHSNFVELMLGDKSQGNDLITGSVPGPSQSIPRIFEAITSAGVSEKYRTESEAAIASALPGSHTRLAHDDPATKNYALARRLAALVVQDLGVEVLGVMKAEPSQRAALMRERVGAKVTRYLRPPDPQDKWWDTLVEQDAGRIDRRLADAERKTPITVNQCALSPLKNIEASRNSQLQLPIGIALHTTIKNSQVWFQVGAGLKGPFPLAPLPGEDRPKTNDTSLFVGAQLRAEW